MNQIVNLDLLNCPTDFRLDMMKFRKFSNSIFITRKYVDILAVFLNCSLNQFKFLSFLINSLQISNGISIQQILIYLLSTIKGKGKYFFSVWLRNR